MALATRPSEFGGSAGAGVVRVERIAGKSAATTVHASSPLRLLLSRPGEVATIVTSTFGGGLVDGDAIALQVDVRDASALVTTQASTKIYRARGDSRGSSSVVRARVTGDALIAVVPDPVVPFAGARYQQRTKLSLDGGASAIVVDVLAAGRVARGERWAFSHVRTELEIVVDERCVARDATLLDERHGEIGKRLGRFEAIGTITLVGPRTRELRARLHEELASTTVVRGAAVVEAASARGDASIVRMAATDVESLVQRVRARIGALCDPWARRP